MRVKFVVLAAILTAAFISSPQAQPAPAPEYVPFSLTEQDWKNLQSYLGEQPAKFAVPLLNFFAQLEAKAVADKAAKDKEPSKK